MKIGCWVKILVMNLNWVSGVYANCFYNFKKPHHHYSYSFPFCQLFCTFFLDTQFSGKRGKLPRYLHTSFSTPLVSVIYYCPWNLSYKHANTNDMAGLPNWCTFFINIEAIFHFLKSFYAQEVIIFLNLLSNLWSIRKYEFISINSNIIWFWIISH